MLVGQFSVAKLCKSMSNPWPMATRKPLSLAHFPSQTKASWPINVPDPSWMVTALTPRLVMPGGEWFAIESLLSSDRSDMVNLITSGGLFNHFGRFLLKEERQNTHTHIPNLQNGNSQQLQGTIPNMYFGEWESPKPTHSRYCQSGEQAKLSYDHETFGVTMGSRRSVMVHLSSSFIHLRNVNRFGYPFC